MKSDPFRAVGLLISALVVIAITAWPFQLLWNKCFVGAVEGVYTIEYLRALGIMLMFGLLLVGAIAMFSLFTVSRDSEEEVSE